MYPRGLRITLKENKEQILSNLTQWLEQEKIADYIFALEGELTDNPHLQGYLNHSSKTQTLRKSFKKKFNFIQGNKSYSFKEYYEGSKTKKVDESFRNYCCKGTKKGVYNIQFYSTPKYKDEDIEKFNNNWYKVKEQIQQVKKEHKKQVQSRTIDFYKKVFNSIYSQQTLQGNPLITDNNPEFVKEQIANYFVDHKVLYNRTKFHNTFCYILAEVNPDEYKSFILRQIQYFNI